VVTAIAESAAADGGKPGELRALAGAPASSVERVAAARGDDDRFAALTCLADEWQQAVDQGLVEQDLTVVTRVLEQQG